MIDRKLNRKDLIGKTCRPVHTIQNRSGCIISDDTDCVIKDVVRGHGFTIQTDKCPHCGQSAYITHVKREDIKLVEKCCHEDRAMVLLRACLDLLSKQKESGIVLNILDQIVEYDGTECDGYCICDDIENYLFDKETD